MRLFSTYLIGLIFGVGISISGMINPAKVLNFFDIAGTWDPSLIFVMGGALVTTFVGYKLVFGRQAPVFETTFSVPASRTIDAKLIGGSAVFGIGWGIAGFCPGGALPALGTGRWEVFAFTAALIAGIFLARFIQSNSDARRAPAA
ncbi:MAG: YeeE/YedE family protein [Dinoroseobacter sp.]|nr:YeeE/YedE family protein [Dinoroseobacter sp.]MDJ0993754.1 YeeE/YedE family protein [Dinoroseobacter sp.]